MCSSWTCVGHGYNIDIGKPQLAFDIDRHVFTTWMQWYTVAEHGSRTNLKQNDAWWQDEDIPLISSCDVVATPSCNHLFLSFQCLESSWILSELFFMFPTRLVGRVPILAFGYFNGYPDICIGVQISRGCKIKCVVLLKLTSELSSLVVLIMVSFFYHF